MHNILEQGRSDPPHDTWESLEFNLGVGSISMCLVPQSSQLCGPGLPTATWIYMAQAHKVFFSDLTC
jgi:hypothetical protein